MCHAAGVLHADGFSREVVNAVDADYEYIAPEAALAHFQYHTLSRD
jgi:hypothetical protein